MGEKSSRRTGLLNMKRVVAAVMVISMATPLYAASTSSRLEVLERRMDVVTDLSLRVENLQLENNQLRGEIDLLRHELETLKTQQREMYLDFERRFGKRRSSDEAPKAVPELKSTSLPAKQEGLSEQQNYNAALKLLMEKHDPAASIAAFQQHLVTFPKGEYADNAQFWLGEARYNGNDLPGSMNEFQKLIETYPQSDKVPDALYKIGHIRTVEGEDQKARTIFEGLLQHYPNTAAAELAAKRLERLAAN